MRNILLLCVFLLNACAHTSQTLYQQLGQQQGIEQLVDEFMLGIGDTPALAVHFADTDPQRFREKLIEQLCELSNGPCRYTGDSMADAHAGHHFSETDFNLLVDTLVNAMDRRDIPTGTQNRLLARLAPLRDQTIYR